MPRKHIYTGTVKHGAEQFSSEFHQSKYTKLEGQG